MSRRTPRNIDVTPPTWGIATGPLVGGDSALATSDGGSSYAEVAFNRPFEPGITGHTFEWTPAGPIPTTATVTIEADWFTDSNGSFLVGFVHPDLGGHTVASFATPSELETHDYGDVQIATVSAAWVEDGAAFLPGVEWNVASLEGDFFTPWTVRITRLTLVVGGEPHLRQRNRDTIRAKNRASRQRGIRARGYL